MWLKEVFKSRITTNCRSRTEILSLSLLESAYASVPDKEKRDFISSNNNNDFVDDLLDIESWLNESNADVLQQYISSKIDKFCCSEVAVF